MIKYYGDIILMVCCVALMLLGLWKGWELGEYLTEHIRIEWER